MSLVPLKVNKSEVSSTAEKVIDWLLSQKIIKDPKTDCVLGSNDGYPPGDNYNSILNSYDHDLLGLRTNGLDVIRTREVFHNGGNGLDSICCPTCSTNIIGSDWGILIDEWYNETGKDTVTCLECKAVHSIIDYKFDPTWAFGNVGFTFWNWPSFTNQFINDLEIITRKSMAIVYGRL
ncbi:MAG: hypothetical protein P4L35_19520 [Ignavibacteriaceae bacterium]|nr:hypothetical protein [Ignavibacteriaceae bacterium]